MKFLDSAPKYLVAHYEDFCIKFPSKPLSDALAIVRVSPDPSVKAQSDLEEMVISDHYANSARIYLPLLGKLLTDERMRLAWTTLNDLFKQEYANAQRNEEILFFNYLVHEVVAWRRIPGRSKKNHFLYLSRISALAEKLRKLLDKADEFTFLNSATHLKHYHLVQLLVDLGSNRVNQAKDFPDEIQQIFMWHLDSINSLLLHLEHDARTVAGKHGSPGHHYSKMAEAHNLMRKLNKHFLATYKSKLHSVVAAIVSVTLDSDNEEVNRPKLEDEKKIPLKNISPQLARAIVNPAKAPPKRRKRIPPPPK